ncbi:F510_1955 family glycosylhydrolase [Pseudonocardia nigra]|uniref:F510_1955 family glycosylhydrolase n=1 Tax=Pseudonocardia nigra TaxID=1921578 RepID=UPI001C5ED828|nr:exo-alpha-sialidase [Pseudonocardia nigra]
MRLPRPRRTARSALRTGLVAAALVALAGCGQAADNAAPADGTATAAPAEAAAIPELAHVHGLGINPADGNLYAASHFGVFRLPSNGEPEQIAGRSQDTMGFTIVGPDHFLGSGHPDPSETDQPPHLGLIESTDAGNTWRSLSLSGEADFHALEAAHGRVYGYDSQTRQLMVTSDKTTWDPRARLALADFAVSPDDPDVLLATTEQGPARSTGGGRTFSPMPGAPLLLLLDWPSTDRLVGIAPDGAVHTSADGGGSWTEQGRVPGRPEALTTHGTTDVYVATDSGIHHSGDNGRTFSMFQPLS